MYCRRDNLKKNLTNFTHQIQLEEKKQEKFFTYLLYYTRSKILKYLQKISFLTYQIWSEVKKVNTEKIS